MNKDVLLVIAKKYNDIFYAISTPEWNQYQFHKLIIVSENVKSENFPLQHLFDNILCVNYSGTRLGILYLLPKLWKLRYELRCSILLLSNPLLVINQFIIKLSMCSRIVAIEDGVMNYCHFSASRNKFKKLLQFFMYSPEGKLLSRISKTYLLVPDMAIYFWGERIKLKINSDILNNLNLPKISGTSIFVGQNLYKYGFFSLDGYCSLVNRIIQIYNIKYYLPHPFASKDETILCEYLDLDSANVTLEILAGKYDFTIYSFASSLLYTTRAINPNVNTFLIRVPQLQEKSNRLIMKKFCSKIIDLD